MARVTVHGVTWGNDRGSRPVFGSIPRWAAVDPDVSVEWFVRPLADFAHGDIGVLARQYDLVVLDHPHIGVAAQDGLVLPLDDLVGDQVIDGQRATVGGSFASYRWRDTSFAFAVDAACHVAARRPDLVAAAELPPSPAWDAVLDFAARRSTGAARVGLSLRPVSAAMCFFSLCANFGAPACRDPDRVVARAVGAEALRLLRRLAVLVHPSSVSLAEPDLLDLMTSTDEIAYIPLNFGYCDYAKPGYRRHRVRFEDIPTAGFGPVGGILGGAGLAISAFSRHPAEAVRYATWLASAATQRDAYVADGGQPAHMAAWDDAVADRRTGGFLSSTRATIDASYLRPRYPGYIGFQQRAGEILAASVWSDGAVDDALDALDDAYRASVAGGSASALELGGVG